MTEPKIAVLIVAAGRGTRCGLDLPKQYQKIGEKTLLRHTIDLFLKHPLTHQILCVIHPDDVELYKESTHGLSIPFVFGGETRQDSTRNGLEALSDQQPDLVFIHDAARPNLSQSKIDELIQVFENKKTKGAILALPMTDTVKYVENGFIVKTLPRTQIFRAQTPQVFCYDTILDCHQKAPHQQFTDDSALLEHFGFKVQIVPGLESNIKVTDKSDFDLVKINLMH